MQGAVAVTGWLCSAPREEGAGGERSAGSVARPRTAGPWVPAPGGRRGQPGGASWELKSSAWRRHCASLDALPSSPKEEFLGSGLSFVSPWGAVLGSLKTRPLDFALRTDSIS